MHFSYAVVVVSFISVSDATVSLKSNGFTIIGRKLETIIASNSYVAFYKIPYAKPPIIELRFKPPKENSFFIQDISDYSQPVNTSGIHDEDCLYLSIYTPLKENKTKTFPVLVWTHEYSDCHGPDFFIDDEVLVVTVSYRSTIFGFLNTGDDFAEGNMGAKDILMALKWIRDNISLFNGDPNRVTIIGAGIASTAVASMLLSPSAEDLFTRAIIIDGSALSPSEYSPFNSEVITKIYYRLKKCLDKLNYKQLYHILGNMSSSDLLLASRNLYDSTEVRDNQRLYNSFGCSVEKPSRGTFMNKLPLYMYERELNNRNVDVMFGYTTLPELYRLQGLANNRKLLHYLSYNFQYLLPFEGSSVEYNSNKYKKIRNKIMDFYFVNGTIKERSLKRYAKYVSDQVIYPLLRQAFIHAKMSQNNVYLYRFAFQGNLNIGWKSSVPNLKWAGATFGDEICYLFKCKSKTDEYKSREVSNEKHFIRKIVRLFANFAKYGNPTPVPSDDILGNLQWRPLKRSGKLQAMNFGRSLRMIDVPEEKRMNFWDQLRKELLQN